jgi:hypothetical protein
MSVNGCDFKFPMWDRDVTTIQGHIADYWFVLMGIIQSVRTIFQQIEIHIILVLPLLNFLFS